MYRERENYHYVSEEKSGAVRALGQPPLGWKIAETTDCSCRAWPSVGLRDPGTR